MKGFLKFQAKKAKGKWQASVYVFFGTYSHNTRAAALKDLNKMISKACECEPHCKNKHLR